MILSASYAVLYYFDIITLPPGDAVTLSLDYCYLVCFLNLLSLAIRAWKHQQPLCSCKRSMYIFHREAGGDIFADPDIQHEYRITGWIMSGAWLFLLSMLFLFARTLSRVRLLTLGLLQGLTLLFLILYYSCAICKIASFPLIGKETQVQLV